MININKSVSNKSNPRTISFPSFNLQQLMTINKQIIINSIPKLTKKINVPDCENGKIILHQHKVYNCYISINQNQKLSIYTEKDDFPTPYSGYDSIDLIQPFKLMVDITSLTTEKIVKRIIMTACDFLNRQAKLSDQELFQLDAPDRLFSDYDYVDWIIPRLAKFKLKDGEVRLKDNDKIDYLIESIIAQPNCQDIIQNDNTAKLLADFIEHYFLWNKPVSNYMEQMFINYVMQALQKLPLDDEVEALTDRLSTIQKGSL